MFSWWQKIDGLKLSSPKIPHKPAWLKTKISKIMIYLPIIFPVVNQKNIEIFYKSWSIWEKFKSSNKNILSQRKVRLKNSLYRLSFSLYLACSWSMHIQHLTVRYLAIVLKSFQLCSSWKSLNIANSITNSALFIPSHDIKIKLITLLHSNSSFFFRELKSCNQKEREKKNSCKVQQNV